MATTLRSRLRAGNRPMHAIAIDRPDRLVSCTFTGKVCVEDRCDAVDAVLAAVDATGFSRILVDLTDAQLVIEDVAQMNRLARRLANDPTLARCRIAYLRPDEPQWDPAVEILAHGRGFRAERFARRDGALAWLH
jgi:hypothetical protein